MYYLIIPSATYSKAAKDAKKIFISFCKVNQDMCFGHTKPEIIKEYSLHDYVNDFGTEKITVHYNIESDPYKMPNYSGTKEVTILEHLKTFFYSLENYANTH